MLDFLNLKLDAMAIKSLYAKFLGGNVGGKNLIVSTNYNYDEETGTGAAETTEATA